MTALRTDVAALYVDKNGCYPKLVEHWFDEARDARTYAGPWPVVAHPPCGPWTRNAFASRQDPECGRIAFRQVREFGGVLEQPAHSRLFDDCRAPRPGELPDSFGGYTIMVRQVDWGHVAPKATWLYLVRCAPRGSPPARRPTHWCRKRPGQTVPDGIKMCSAQQRRRTPVAFAEWLLDLAAQARRTEAA